MQKGVFFVFVLFFVGCVFFPLCFCSCLEKKKVPKRLFSVVLEFFLFCSPRRNVFKISLLFLFSFCSVFSFCPPFQNSISSLWLLSFNPFLENICFWGFLLSLFFVAFPLIMFACFFETNFLTSGFWNSSCFHFWLFLPLLFLFWFSCFCHYVFMLALFLVCFSSVLVLFLFCFLLCFRLWKCCFPCNSFFFAGGGGVMLVAR